MKQWKVKAKFSGVGYFYVEALTEEEAKGKVEDEDYGDMEIWNMNVEEAINAEENI